MQRNFFTNTPLLRIISAFALAFLISSCALSPKQQETVNWNKTIKRVSSGVISINVDAPISFDGKSNSSTEATGFIVDAQLGLVLTNRHVVTPGPVTATGVFVNNEEVELTPIYIDPVHDFGFYQYQPSELKHIQPHEFTLNPSSVKVGLEIRIIGNDAGQKISILDGTISRLDRSAPLYGKYKYNDFNTFYIQASTASTGGSSGSPVINAQGEVVALNAGSNRKSSNAYYLPLDDVSKTLSKLQNSQTITRGSLLTTFEQTSYAELVRLGLTQELEQEYRQQFPDAKGLLVVKSIIPHSPAAAKLAVGDILLSINQQAIVDFVSVDNQLNTHVNQTVNIKLQRQNEQINVSVPVSDLNQLTPKSFLSFESGIFHDLSYQQARHFNLPLKGVYIAQATNSFKYAGVADRSVIVEFAGQTIENVDHFKKVISQLKTGDKVHARYVSQREPSVISYALIEINKRWNQTNYCQLNLTTHSWPCQKVEQQTASAGIQIVDSSNSYESYQMPSSGNMAVDKISPSLVIVQYLSPFAVQGRGANTRLFGTGVVVDKEKGLIAISRTTVPSVLGEIKLVFNNTLEIDGKIEAVHPIHNVALISYDPALVNGKVKQAKRAKHKVERGDNVIQVGFNWDGEVEYRATQVDNIQPIWLSLGKVPKFMDMNIEGIDLVNANDAIDGVLITPNGELASLWLNFDQEISGGSSAGRGVSLAFVDELIQLVETGKPLYSLEISLYHISPVDAIRRGLPQKWLEKLSNQKQKKVLVVDRFAASSDSANKFKRGDLLLAVNNQTVTQFRQVEKLSQQAEVQVTLFRDGQVITEQITTTALTGTDIDRVLFWAGITLHEPHRAAKIQKSVEGSGVYIAYYRSGSPARRYKVFPVRRIIEVDGQTIATVDDFIKAVKDKKHRQAVRIKTMDTNNKPAVITLKMDNLYWPFYELRKTGDTWQQIDYAKENN
ncbi:hypothetical protein C2869_01820 [Saccharobesus litoralis]|uniref:PDZ domain-containing protein n=1 Tax=Saccharobesus litoralis TaxID=2172099 RepID=A0A2S0VM38_9ALTE|nr:trypsin-like peptidase domain-containing protein [Saccharobesus litoralis]AWB65259.1 hypothetical protein C2869_01820 [Saccharobesus litoralis]